MKLKLLLIALLIVAVQAHAQDITKKDAQAKEITSGYIAVHAGIGIPIGAFGKHKFDPLISNQGYAMPGPCSLAEFAIPFARSHFGFAAQIGFYEDKINTPAANATYAAFIGNGGTVIINDLYKTTIFLGGLYVTLPVGKISIDAKLYWGVASCALPAVQTESYVAFIQPASPTIDKAVRSVFAYGGNITVRYTVVGHFSVLAQGGIFTATPMYPAIAQHLYRGDYSGDVAQPTMLINMSAGIGYQF
jgi:hypothetical protein